MFIQLNERTRLQPNLNSADNERYSLLRSGRRIPELDGLRGVAIGLVIITHYFTAPVTVQRPNPLAYLQIATRLSWSGVDLFFILSGFLIGGILLDARSSSNYFKVFYIRRACRILPVYLIFCALIAACYRYVYPSDQALFNWMFNFPMPWYSYLTFTQNFWMAHFNTLGPAVLAITWSLAIEEQLYLTLPTVIRFVRPATLPYLLLTGILAAAVFRVALLIWYPHLQTALYALLPSRMDTLLLGALAAWAVRNPDVWNILVARRRLLWGMFAFFAAGLVYFTSTSSYYSIPTASAGYDWLALFYLTALLLVLMHPNSWLGRAMRQRWLMGLGIIAYSTYLIHVLVYGLCIAYFRHHGPYLRNLTDLWTTLSALVLTVTLAQLSWWLFERKFVRFGHKFKYQRLTAEAVVSDDRPA
jgi:peptidoglycan/LPS O-acetylase OafA/YrhL